MLSSEKTHTTVIV